METRGQGCCCSETGVRVRGLRAVGGSGRRPDGRGEQKDKGEDTGAGELGGKVGEDGAGRRADESRGAGTL